MAGWTLYIGTSVPEDARELKGAGPRGSRSRFPFLWGGSGSSPPELGPRWGQVVVLRRAARSTSGLPLQVGLQERRQRALRPPLPRPPGAAAGHDLALCSCLQVYLCPFQFSVILRKGETKQKSLFISFQGM